jgi:hypothetical protein
VYADFGQRLQTTLAILLGAVENLIWTNCHAYVFHKHLNGLDLAEPSEEDDIPRFEIFG